MSEPRPMPCQRIDPMTGGSCGMGPDSPAHYDPKRTHDYTARDRRNYDRRAEDEGDPARHPNRVEREAATPERPFTGRRCACGHESANTTEHDRHLWNFHNGPLAATPEPSDLQCKGYAGDPGASAPRCESYTGHPGRHFIRPFAATPEPPSLFPPLPPVPDSAYQERLQDWPATPEPSDLRAAFDRLTTWPGVVRQWPHTGNWPPEHVVAVSYDDVERIIDAHRCYDEAALAEALHAEYGATLDHTGPVCKACREDAAAIIERLEPIYREPESCPCGLPEAHDGPCLPGDYDPFGDRKPERPTERPVLATRCICSHKWLDHTTWCDSSGCPCRFTAGDFEPSDPKDRQTTPKFGDLRTAVEALPSVIRNDIAADPGDVSRAAVLAIIDGWGTCKACGRIWHRDGYSEHAQNTGHYPDGSPMEAYA